MYFFDLSEEGIDQSKIWGIIKWEKIDLKKYIHKEK